MSESRPLALIKRAEVEARTGLARSTLFTLVKAGDFPSPVKVGGRAVAWVESEVDGWITERIRRSRAA